jgi:hypothetical protein
LVGGVGSVTVEAVKKLPFETLLPPFALNTTAYCDAVVTLLEAVEATDVPRVLVAVTVNVYAVPRARPVTVQLVDVVVQVAPEFDVAV